MNNTFSIFYFQQLFKPSGFSFTGSSTLDFLNFML